MGRQKKTPNQAETAKSDAPKWLTLREIATEYRRSYKAVHEWVTKGVGGVKLQARKAGGRGLVRPENLEEFFAAMEAASAIRPDEPEARQTRRPRRPATAAETKKTLERLRRKGLM